MDGWTDGQTDGPTDGPMDRASYRDARTHLKVGYRRTNEPTDRWTDGQANPVIEMRCT